METENIKKSQSEVKKTLAGINRLDEAEDQISDLEGKVVENTKPEQQKSKNKKKVRIV